MQAVIKRPVRQTKNLTIKDVAPNTWFVVTDVEGWENKPLFMTNRKNSYGEKGFIVGFNGYIDYSQNCSVEILPSGTEITFTVP